MKFLSKGKDDGRGEKILAAVIQMAKALDMPVIAEGVEEKKQVQMLKRLGCNYIQGFISQNRCRRRIMNGWREKSRE